MSPLLLGALLHFSSPALAEGPAVEAPAAGAPAAHPGEAPKAEGHGAKADEHGAKAEGHGAEGGEAHGGEGGHGGGHGGIPTEALFFTLINLTLFLVLMARFAGRPVGDALKSRALEVRAGLDEAGRMQQDAQQRFADVESRLVALGKQVEEMKTEAEAEAAREAKVLDQRAEAEAQRMKETAERTIREETQRATNTIRGEAAAMAVELAREILRREVNGDDQARLARQFLDAVKKEASHG